jgi:hypothetical protein
VPLPDAKFLERIKDVLVGLTGWIEEVGLNHKMPADLDDEVSDLLRDLDEMTEEM